MVREWEMLFHKREPAFARHSDTYVRALLVTITEGSKRITAEHHRNLIVTTIWDYLMGVFEEAHVFDLRAVAKRVMSCECQICL